ncbi:MAG: hypothetical protein QM656_07115 [Paracoccaceae bacterium]
MSDFGYRPPPIRLLDQKLTLDPEVETMMNEMALKALAERLFNPRWQLSTPYIQRLLALAPAMPAPSPSPTPGFLNPPQSPQFSPAPALPTASGLPKPGEVSDVLGALWKLPVVQTHAGVLLGRLKSGANSVVTDFRNSGAGGKIGMISVAGVFTAAVLTPILANQPMREAGLNLIKGKDIPVPGLNGWSFMLVDDLVVKPEGAGGRPASTPNPGNVSGFMIKFEGEF